MAIEAVSGWFAILALLFILIQAVMWGMALSAARSAADSALEQARAETGTAGSGAQAAVEVLDVRVGAALQGAEVSIDRGEETVTVTVTGRAYPLPLPVSVTAAGPTERFVPDTEAGP
ncbi:hypothetical protein GCM10029992_36110 [Glycomyces albus]